METKVPFTMENIKACVCYNCPVQIKSKCAMDKKKTGMERMAKMEKGEAPMAAPKPEDLPGMYCATGAAICKDLNYNEACACPNCPVWEKYKLSGYNPMVYYCRDGEAV